MAGSGVPFEFSSRGSSSPPTPVIIVKSPKFGKLISIRQCIHFLTDGLSSCVSNEHEPMNRSLLLPYKPFEVNLLPPAEEFVRKIQRCAQRLAQGYSAY